MEVSPEHHPDLWTALLGDLGRSERLREILAQLLSEPASTRQSLLGAMTGHDPTTRALIEAVLEHIEAADVEGFLTLSTDAEPLASGTEASAAAAGLPRSVGPFEILGQLGEGATGIVYRARAAGPLGRDVAVKVNKASASERAASRFALEIEVLGELDHPNIAKIFDAGRLEDGSLWAACELINGVPVTKAPGAFSLFWRERVDLIRQAAVGLHHAHLRGVVHRDVKPSNLLVTNSNGNPSQLRIIDFGVARRLSLDAAAEAVTEPGLLVGTLVYMSPEQLAGRPANAASDIYALGLVLYETIEGRPAHGSVPGGLGELLRRTEQPVRERISGCEGHERDLQAIIAKATDPEPARRYPSAQHMADDLERVLSGKPVLARRQTFAYLASRYIRRHPIVSAVLVAALLALSGLVTAVVISRDRLAFEVRDQRELLRALIDESLEQLSVTSGTSESRAAMVRSLRVRTDRLLAQSPSNVDLLRSKARLLREEGDLDSSAGRFAAAEALFLESGEIYHSIYNSDGDVRSGRMWAESLVRRGDARDAQEDRDAARAMYAEAHSIFVELRDMNPKDIVALDDLCWSFDRLAAVDYGADRHVESLGLLEERWRLSETLMKASPDRVLSRFNRAVGALRLARHFAHLGHDDEAFLWAERAGPDIEAVVASQPDRTPFVVWFNEWVTMTSQALEHRGDREGAIRRVRTSLDVASTLWSRAHGDWHALWVALRVHYTGYENLERWGQHDDAVEALREAVRIVESAPGGRRSQAIIRLESLILESARMRGLIPAATE